jgi:hypothetical protein
VIRAANVPIAFLAATLWACAAGPRQGDSIRVLFFGNSVTYVGNLPAVLSALCSTAGSRCDTQMIVEGGATLSDRVAHRSLDRVGAAGRFDYLILQERGGDLIARADRNEVRTRAEAAAGSLVADARKRKMTPVLLGTYQGLTAPSQAIVTAESALATKLGALHIPVAQTLDCARRKREPLRWFDRDGMHPGPDLTLLMAVLLFRELHGASPRTMDLLVQAPIYGVSSGLRASQFASVQRPGTSTSRLITYDAETLHKVIELATHGCA